MHSALYTCCLLFNYVLLTLPTVSKLRNVALHKPSAGVFEDPKETTDGKTETSSCAISSMSSLHGGIWWIVDLENRYTIRAVRIYKVRNYFTHYEFQKFYIYASTQNPYPDLVFTRGDSFPGDMCLYQQSPISSRVWNDLPCQTNVTGRFITLWMPNFSGYLYLCEFEAITDMGPLLSPPDFDIHLMNTTMTLAVFPEKKSSSILYHQLNLTRPYLPLCALECLSANTDGYYVGRGLLFQVERTSRVCQCAKVASFDSSLMLVDDPDWTVMEMDTTQMGWEGESVEENSDSDSTV